MKSRDPDSKRKPEPEVLGCITVRPLVRKTPGKATGGAGEPLAEVRLLQGGVATAPMRPDTPLRRTPAIKPSTTSSPHKSVTPEVSMVAIRPDPLPPKPIQHPAPGPHKSFTRRVSTAPIPPPPNPIHRPTRSLPKTVTPKLSTASWPRQQLSPLHPHPSLPQRPPVSVPAQRPAASVAPVAKMELEKQLTKEKMAAGDGQVDRKSVKRTAEQAAARTTASPAPDETKASTSQTHPSLEGGAPPAKKRCLSVSAPPSDRKPTEKQPEGPQKQTAPKADEPASSATTASEVTPVEPPTGKEPVDGHRAAEEIQEYLDQAYVSTDLASLCLKHLADPPLSSLAGRRRHASLIRGRFSCLTTSIPSATSWMTWISSVSN